MDFTRAGLPKIRHTGSRNRFDRAFLKDRPEDQRGEGARDRDRILYTSGFRRLAGVTQVVAASEGLFHTRLTHTLEVAQIARRVAQYLPELEAQKEVIRAIEDIDPEFRIDPEVAEAAALAHDLGHPPFGHVAEDALDLAIRNRGVADGFEGNAQSFRAVTRLFRRHRNFLGLNLTRGSLAALVKYPWKRGRQPQPDDPPEVFKRFEKWGAYETEADLFAWATAMCPTSETGAQRTAEAEIMDWADDVAYAVHDVEDFYRAGLVPLDRLMRRDMREWEEFLEGAYGRWNRIRYQYEEDETEALLTDLMEMLDRPPLRRPFMGLQEQRGALRTWTSEMIDGFIRERPGMRDAPAILLRVPDVVNPSLVERDERAEKEIKLLKELVWHYVINNSSLAAQQEGHKAIVTKLFDTFFTAAAENPWLLPPGYRQLLKVHEAAADQEEIPTVRTRIACDVICAMTEQQAVAMHQRVTGQASGSVIDAILR